MKAEKLKYSNMIQEQPKFLGSYHIILLDGDKTNAKWQGKHFTRHILGVEKEVENNTVACFAPLF